MNSGQQHRDNQQFHKPEVLAPAGSFEALRAAVYAGADAVYVGGTRFGARAFASNLTETELLEAIDFAHIYGVRVYLTINTLLKKREIEGELFSYLLPFYKCGLDAVIVQDIGVFMMVRRWFPDLDIHVSTQMGIVSKRGAELVKQLGAKRVVPGRELSLDEVQRITAINDLEVECFVHGALCYCYSGQCFLSSRIGGRSGNRGRCAQPCRLPYTIGQNSSHILSPKDIASIYILPELIRSGIHSFKIEGRMKKPEYVAAVTKIYRKYVNLAMECFIQDKQYWVNPDDKMLLMQMYNRGGFHNGYYYQHNGADMMETGRVGHHGVYVGEIAYIEKNKISFQVQETLYAGDVLELRTGLHSIELTCPETIRVGKMATLNARELKKLSKGVPVYRMKSPQLIHDLFSGLAATCKRPIRGEVILSVGKAAKLNLCLSKENGITVYGETVQMAEKQPLSEEQVKKAIGQLGESHFFLEELTIYADEGVFLPVKALKSLRREGVAALQQTLLSPYKREKGEEYFNRYILKESSGMYSVHEEIEEENWEHQAAMAVHSKKTQMVMKAIVSVKTMEQLKVVVKERQVDGILLSVELYEQAYQTVVKTSQGAMKKWFLALPRLFRYHEKICLKDGNISSSYGKLKELLMRADGCLVSSIDSLAWTLSYAKEQNRRLFIILEDTLYSYNQAAVNAWQEILKDSPNCSLYAMTLPAELSLTELLENVYPRSMVPVYGSRVMMTSVQCVKKTSNQCLGESSLVPIRDRKNKEYYMENNCYICQSTLYESEPLSMSGGYHEVAGLFPYFIRLDFLKETAEETAHIVNSFVDEYIYQKSKCDYISGNTGHYYQPIG